MYKKILVTWLIFTFVFPPHVFAENPPPPINREESDRAKLRKAFHLASWKLTYFIKREMPWAMKARPADTYGLFRPYAHCEPSPYATLPGSIAEIDAVITPVREAVV